MSTIPLTLIDGSIAMPSLRPLDHLPAPFGRDWALLPPGYSWRAELKALYAAMLRTFCMSDQTILSFCRWVPLSARRAPTSASAATAKRATVFEAPREQAPCVLAEATVIPAVEQPALATVARNAPPHWGALAGGVCALSGAAMLTWIAFSHLAHRHTADDAKPVDRVTASLDAQVVERRVPDAATVHGVVREVVSEATAAKVDARSGNMTSASGHVVPNHARPPASTEAAAAAPTVVNDALSRRRNAVREAVDSPRVKNRRHTARRAAANPLPRAAAVNDDMLHTAVPRTTQRVLPRPSAAGAYSPRASAQPGLDEYVDVTMSAATQLRDVASPRSSMSNNLPAAGSTEWMSHLSQRRVTEIPDQFAK
ncbi:hypothetical protein FVF58_31375 [Paraburkholderia panacisoli]|uniref:Uncharacterized protein n=1 Tax=Paraburkholderia panacisoli TaxID=2603818 RepID=A0A5B0GPD7_9BURK|nr:hypothetical protein [Paraburkholderia panacisoli]KAA1004705.1 hypothetical protein FVF58_31375 [Paraburkholderia panacisoli]